MQWFFVSCILLAAGADVLSNHRPKRDLSYIKNLIASKLFGSETIFLQQPEIPKNESYQLFKIEGYDDILIKVTWIPEKKKENVKVVKEKLHEPVTVSPEVAIIGSYLGTTTESETLLALEIVKNLVCSGILRGKLEDTIQEVVVPMTAHLPYKDYSTPQHVKPVKVFIQDRDPFYVYPTVANNAGKVDIINHNPVPFYPGNYPPMAITSELKYKPVKTKYSYKQKGENADMTYESYNNEDVIVTRTAKEPLIPQYIKLRFAEVASIGANPYHVRSQEPLYIDYNTLPEEHLVQPINIVSGSYAYVNPPLAVQPSMQKNQIPPYGIDPFPLPTKSIPNLEFVEELGYVVPNSINSIPVFIDRSPILRKPLTVPNYVIHTRPSFENYTLTQTEVDNINKIYGKTKQNKNNKEVPPKMPLNNPKLTGDNLFNKTNKKDAAEEIQKRNNMSKNSDTNEHIVSQYLYKQMNHNSRDKYTIVRVEDPPKLTKHADPAKTNVEVQTTEEIPDDFIFMPPENVNIPPPNMIPRTNNIQNEIKNNNREVSSETENYPKGFTFSKSKDDKLNLVASDINGKAINQHSLKNDPIVVLEDNLTQKQNPARTYKRGNKNFRPYQGGPVF